MLQFHSSRQSAQQRICASFVVAAGLLAATLARVDYLWIQRGQWGQGLCG